MLGSGARRPVVTRRHVRQLCRPLVASSARCRRFCLRSERRRGRCVCGRRLDAEVAAAASVLAMPATSVRCQRVTIGCRRTTAQKYGGVSQQAIQRTAVSSTEAIGIFGAQPNPRTKSIEVSSKPKGSQEKRRKNATKYTHVHPTCLRPLVERKSANVLRPPQVSRAPSRQRSTHEQDMRVVASAAATCTTAHTRPPFA